MMPPTMMRNGNESLSTTGTSTWGKGVIGMHRWPITKFAPYATANKGKAGGRWCPAPNVTSGSKYGRVATGANVATVKHGQ